VACKKVPHIDDQGEPVEPETENALKFERFIFDALPFAAPRVVVEAAGPRVQPGEETARGSDTPETAQQALCANFAAWLQAAGARVAADAGSRISPLFGLMPTTSAG